MSTDMMLIIGAGVLAILYGVYAIRSIMAADAGNERMQEIAIAIQQGAAAYLNRQYTTIAIVGAIIAVLVGWLLGLKVAIGFLVGATLSGVAGYIGMLVSVRANVRTTQAASESLGAGLSIAFRSGAVTGMLVAGLALLSVSVYFVVLTKFMGLDPSGREVIDALVALGFGASLISIFARLGGGIFTKGADVGGDLVGKVEAGIPEDDPRNPATIADNVGDNVGDCAGMAADLFETYAVTIVATMVLASIFFNDLAMMVYPLTIGATCIVTSIIGTFFVRLGSNNSIMGALYKGFIASAVLSLIALYFVTDNYIGLGEIEDSGFTGMDLYICGVLGLVITGLIIWITEYYTGVNYRPVKSVAAASVTGHGTNVIQGLAVSMEATALPALVIVAGIISTYSLAGLFGIAIAVSTMLALAGMVVALDAFGPVTDNAGGIAEMAEMGPETREITDSLDEVGNSTAAIGKGFAISAAALAALALISAYIVKVSNGDPDFVLAINDPIVLVGMFIGGIFPFLVSSITMTAVGDAAFEMIIEVRRQFKEIPGLMEGKAKPDTARCVDIATRAALRKMILPGSLAVLAPVVIGFGLGPKALGGMLGGALICCVMMALMMANAGGAWDNAKKYVEKGNYGGKGSDVHKAAVVGDTVGDPLKDTSGPAMNILINVMAIVSLVIAPLLI
jgi:K(+)-stimulated pyrophosphate-energized sodium pump